MDTLKATALTLLIPFGWLSNQSAAAYPLPLDRIDPGETCHQTPDHSDNWAEGWGPGGPDIGLNVLPDGLAGRIRPPVTTWPHPERSPYIDTCRLDLDLIQIDWCRHLAPRGSRC